MKLKFTALLVFVTLFTLANNPLKVKVVDENKEPLTGVKIISVEENATLFTDFDGVSELSNISDTKVFKIEYIGYQSGYIEVSPNSDQEINVVLLKK